MCRQPPWFWNPDLDSEADSKFNPSNVFRHSNGWSESKQRRAASVEYWTFWVFYFICAYNLFRRDTVYGIWQALQKSGTHSLYHKIRDQTWRATLQQGSVSNFLFCLSWNLFSWKVFLLTIVYLSVQMVATINENFAIQRNSTSKMKFNIVSYGEVKFITYVFASDTYSHQTRFVDRIKLVQHQDFA